MAPNGENSRDNWLRKDCVLRLNPRNTMKLTLFLFLLIPFLAARTANEVEITSEPSHHFFLENEFVRVFKVEVAPHASTLLHRHRHAYVVVTLGDDHVSNEVEG